MLWIIQPCTHTLSCFFSFFFLRLTPSLKTSSEAAWFMWHRGFDTVSIAFEDLFLLCLRFKYVHVLQRIPCKATEVNKHCPSLIDTVYIILSMLCSWRVGPVFSLEATCWSFHLEDVRESSTAHQVDKVQTSCGVKLLPCFHFSCLDLLLLRRVVPCHFLCRFKIWVGIFATQDSDWPFSWCNYMIINNTEWCMWHLELPCIRNEVLNLSWCYNHITLFSNLSNPRHTNGFSSAFYSKRTVINRDMWNSTLKKCEVPLFVH